MKINSVRNVAMGSINKVNRRIGENFNSKSNIGENKEKKSLTIQKDGINEVIKNLTSAKESFLEQKQKIISSDMDSEQKKYMLKDLNEKIGDIDSQIQQINMQEKQEEIEEKQEALEKKKQEEEKYKKNDDEVRDGIIIAKSLNELIKASHSTEVIHGLKDIKNREAVEAGYIKPDDNPSTYNNKRLAQIRKSAVNIEANISKEVRNINKTANDIREREVDPKEDENNKSEEEKQAFGYIEKEK